MHPGLLFSTTSLILLQIEDNVEVEKVSSEEERHSFAEKLSEVSLFNSFNECACIIYALCFSHALILLQVQEWLYTDGEDASANEFKEHLELLKAIGDPIFFRLVIINFD